MRVGRLETRIIGSSIIQNAIMIVLVWKILISEQGKIHKHPALFISILYAMILAMYKLSMHIRLYRMRRVRKYYFYGYKMV